MAKYKVTINTTTRLSLKQNIANVGWSIINNVMVHEECTKGRIYNDNIEFAAGSKYIVKYSIVKCEDGFLQFEIGDKVGLLRDKVGRYEEEFEPSISGKLKIYGDGIVEIGAISILGNAHKGETLVFSEKGLKWSGEYGFVPDMFVRYKDMFVSFKDGVMWKHNSDEVSRNIFYGKKYPSKIKFISNKEVSINKVFYNIKLDGIGNWSIDSIKTNQTDQFPRGMESELPFKNLKLIDGKYWGDFFRDMNDPKFSDIKDLEKRKIMSLFEGRMLQGNYLTIELSCDSEQEIKLLSVAVMSAAIERNF